MLLDLAAPASLPRARPFPLADRPRWGVDSEHGRLTDVMLSAPAYLELVPCNTVARDAVAQGMACCPEAALSQHRGLVRALTDHGVRCHSVPPAPGLADQCFTRDSTLMSPWGLLELSLAAPHRAAEPAHVARTAASWGVKLLGALGEGRIEGGDVCLVRPGTVAIGWSGERTDAQGAAALAGFFEARGWRALVTRFHPHFLHLDTLFTMVSRDRAVACRDALEPDFLAEIGVLGIDLVSVEEAEVGRLGANILCLGEGRLLSSTDNRRLNAALGGLGYAVTALPIDQFTRCGGGMHCLTMPLARLPG